MRHNRIPHNLKLQIPTAAVFEPLLDPARYKGVWGGRGSGKSHFAGGMAAEDALAFPGENGGEGLRMVCIREVQKSLKESSKRMIEDKLRSFGLGERQGFKSYHDRIALPGDGVMIFEGMQDHSADSIKSLEGYHRAWVEEAQTLSERSLMMLRPTIRTPESELWFTWNPRRPTDAVDQMLRGLEVPTGAVVIRSNWNDNPWFPKELEQERQDCLKNDPANYDHIWEGGYATVQKGAYYAQNLTMARLERRIGMYPRDPLSQVFAFWDIGGTSNSSDATAIWFVQFIGEEVRCLADYEAVGQPFSAHVNWMRKHGYEDAMMVLPHDGKKHDIVHRITPKSYLQEAGFDVTTLDNGGKGAAMMRVEETRKIFGGMTFNEETTKGGREALGWYHEKIDENRGIGLGPEHDWSSHSADAFGNIALYKKTRIKRKVGGRGPVRRNLKGIA